MPPLVLTLMDLVVPLYSPVTPIFVLEVLSTVSLSIFNLFPPAIPADEFPLPCVWMLLIFSKVAVYCGLSFVYVLLNLGVISVILPSIPLLDIPNWPGVGVVCIAKVESNSPVPLGLLIGFPLIALLILLTVSVSLYVPSGRYVDVIVFSVTSPTISFLSIPMLKGCGVVFLLKSCGLVILLPTFILVTLSSVVLPVYSVDELGL